MNDEQCQLILNRLEDISTSIGCLDETSYYSPESQRERYARSAMQGLLCDGFKTEHAGVFSRDLAAFSWRIADAMLLAE